MKPIVTIIFVLTTLFFNAPVKAQENNDVFPSGEFEELRKQGTALVMEAVSPMTLRLKDGKFIHLTGIDIPDYNVHNPGELSQTAVTILNDMLKNKKITLYQTKKSDRGRINRMRHHLAHIRTEDDIWIQGMLISLGIARVRTTQYTPEMATQLYDLEKQARQNKRGLWAMPDFQILPPEQTENHIGSYQIVEGTIRSASRRKNRIYLNFGNNWKEDFTVSISSSNAKRFNKQKINPLSWNGKHIRVRGWLSYRNGPYLEVDHPERFEINLENPQQTQRIEDIFEEKKDALPKLND